MLRYQRQQRLTCKSEFDRVFEQPTFRFGNQYLLVMARIRETDGPGRLGLVASKKHLKNSVARNRFKRQTRESFRHHQTLLDNCDILVLSRAKSLECAAMSDELAAIWPRLERRCSKVRREQTGSDHLQANVP